MAKLRPLSESKRRDPQEVQGNGWWWPLCPLARIFIPQIFEPQYPHHEMRVESLTSNRVSVKRKVELFIGMKGRYYNSVRGQMRINLASD